MRNSFFHLVIARKCFTFASEHPKGDFIISFAGVVWFSLCQMIGKNPSDSHGCGDVPKLQVLLRCQESHLFRQVRRG